MTKLSMRVEAKYVIWNFSFDEIVCMQSKVNFACQSPLFLNRRGSRHNPLPQNKEVETPPNHPHVVATCTRFKTKLIIWTEIFIWIIVLCNLKRNPLSDAYHVNRLCSWIVPMILFIIDKKPRVYYTIIIFSGLIYLNFPIQYKHFMQCNIRCCQIKLPQIKK